MTFASYVSKDMYFNDYNFDFLIANKVAEEWYGSKNQSNHHEIQWCVSKITPGMTVVDCGAHHGLLALIFANAVGPTGKVIAYEVLPINAAVIQANADLNQAANLIVRPVGLGDKNETAVIAINGGNTVVMDDQLVTDQSQPLASDNLETIELVRLDDDLPAGTKIDFIKVDVEGNDLPAILGMIETLNQRPIIALELHNFIFEDKEATLKQIFDILEPLDYSWEMHAILHDVPHKIAGLDVAHIAPFYNPHIFGTPNPR